MPDAVVIVNEEPPEEVPVEAVVLETGPPPSEQLAAIEIIERHDEEVTAEAEHQEKHRYTADKLSEHDIALTACNDAIARLEQGLEECRNMVSTTRTEVAEVVIEETEPEPVEAAEEPKKKMGLFGHRKS